MNDLSTGVIVFEGLTADELASIRVIPEEGTTLTQPANQEYRGVDGFWWRGDRRWFKIPGGTHVRVRPAGATPSAAPSVTTLSMNGMELQISSSPASLLFQQLKGPAAAAGWQPDTAASAHPTDSPF